MVQIESYHYPEGQEQAAKQIWIFGALCLYWCDVELHKPIWFLGISLSGAKVFGDAFSGILTMGIFWKIRFGERKFSADWFSGMHCSSQ